MPTKIFWTPSGVTLDSIGDKRFVDLSDGDTPNVRMNVRMLSIDTPEKAPTGEIRKVDELQRWFADAAAWLATGSARVDPALAAHLVPRLARSDAVAAHFAQGAQASAEHQRLVDERLAKPGGRRRNLFIRVADQRFDRYGRLLAYVAPDYSAKEREKMTRRERATFNLLMVESGWAAPFVLYPSIPGEEDLPMLRDAAADAIAAKRGAWADPLGLTGYEFRMAERLAALRRVIAADKKPSREQREWVTRYVVDASTATLHAPQAYVTIAPQDRVFVWPDDVRRAVADLNLVPGPSLGG
jgi:endonuclease YncB( thermonuclease family)